MFTPHSTITCGTAQNTVYKKLCNKITIKLNDKHQIIHDRITDAFLTISWVRSSAYWETLRITEPENVRGTTRPLSTWRAWLFRPLWMCLTIENLMKLSYLRTWQWRDLISFLLKILNGTIIYHKICSMPLVTMKLHNKWNL